MSSLMPSGVAVFSCAAPVVADLLPITCCDAPVIHVVLMVRS